MKKTILLYIPIFILQIINTSYSQEILVEKISTANQNNYFSETNTSQPALIVRGIWSGNSYFWAPVQIGDTITEVGFINDEPFNGLAVDYDSLGHLLGKYSFINGYLQKIEEFNEDGKSRVILNLNNGIPHGEQKDFYWNGELRILKTFNNGILDGQFYWSRERIDYGLPPCVETGIYDMGIYKKTSETCTDE